jgi:hypothetical protein
MCLRVSHFQQKKMKANLKQLEGLKVTMRTTTTMTRRTVEMMAKIGPMRLQQLR